MRAQFRYGNLSIAQREVLIELSFTAENTGARDGTEVVQIYVGERLALSTRPERELKAFARVPVKAGATSEVRVKIPVDMLNFTDGHGERIVEPGEFEVALLVGSSSRDLHFWATRCR